MDADVAAVQNRIDFAPPLRVAALPNGEPDCTVSPAIGKNATGFRFLPLRCAGAACTGVRAVVLSFENVDPLPDNSVLYTCRVAVAANAAEGDYSLRNSDLGASDARGGFVTAQGNDGAVRVRRSSLAIDIDDAETAPGEDVVIGVRLRQMGAAAVGAQNRIDFAAPLRIAARVDGAPDCTVNAAIDKRATTFRFLPIGCVGSGCTGTRAVVLAFDNLAVIPDAAVLYTCHVEVEADAAPGSYVLRNAEANGSDAAGAFLPASAGDGNVTIFQDDALVAIDIGSVRAISGQRASVDVRLRSLGPDAPAVAGTQNEIVFDPATPIAATEDGRPACAVNPDLDKGGTSFLFLPPDCVPAVDCTRLRAFVLALDNTETIPDGAVLYQCDVRVASDAAIGVYPLRNENAVAGDPSGDPVAARGRNGQVEVICAGDCDGNHQVAIFELLRSINILLGNQPLSACELSDADGSGDVAVNEIVQAVSSALRGCRLAE